ncbi:MAG: dUTP diphosphatase [Clostridia bacterium]|nr:dUTP diphosphatase [Clostridia bacterium]
MQSVARFELISENQYTHDFSGFETRLSLSEIPIPRRATEGSAGYDFACPVAVTLLPGEMRVIPTGLRSLIEPGWVLVICPRSSLGRKYGMRLANTVGIIDSDYALAENEGHILVAVVNGGDQPLTLNPGDRFCQGIFLPFGVAEEETVTARRTGGYGSTGN